jgi:tetratricopeptide (TPR) repeat protein
MKRYFLLWVVAISFLIIGCTPRRAAVVPPPPDASEKRQEAIKAAERQDWDAAIRLSGEAIALDPKNRDAYWVRGLAHLKKKEHAKAEADCTQAIKLDEKYAAAYRERGLAYLGQQKYPEAIADFTAYLKLRPEDPEGFEWRALANSKSGNDAAASADLRQAEKLKAGKK